MPPLHVSLRWAAMTSRVPRVSGARTSNSARRLFAMCCEAATRRLCAAERERRTCRGPMAGLPGGRRGPLRCAAPPRRGFTTFLESHVLPTSMTPTRLPGRLTIATLLLTLTACTSQPEVRLRDEGKSVEELRGMLADADPEVQARGALGLSRHGPAAAPAPPAPIAAFNPPPP